VHANIPKKKRGANLLWISLMEAELLILWGQKKAAVRKRLPAASAKNKAASKLYVVESGSPRVVNASAPLRAAAAAVWLCKRLSLPRARHFAAGEVGTGART